MKFFFRKRTSAKPTRTAMVESQPTSGGNPVSQKQSLSAGTDPKNERILPRIPVNETVNQATSLVSRKESLATENEGTVPKIERISPPIPVAETTRQAASLASRKKSLATRNEGTIPKNERISPPILDTETASQAASKRMNSYPQDVLRPSVRKSDFVASPLTQYSDDYTQDMSRLYSYTSDFDASPITQYSDDYTQDMSRLYSYTSAFGASPITQYSDSMSPVESTSAIPVTFYDLIEREDPYSNYATPYMEDLPTVGSLASTGNSSRYAQHETWRLAEWLQRAPRLTNQRLLEDKVFVCLHSGCSTAGKFRRAADLDRHYKDTHRPQYLFDCPDKKCNRVGENGFKRYDHLVEHRRTVHVKNIPKKGPREYDQWKRDEQRRRYRAVS